MGSLTDKYLIKREVYYSPTTGKMVNKIRECYSCGERYYDITTIPVDVSITGVEWGVGFCTDVGKKSIRYYVSLGTLYAQATYCHSRGNTFLMPNRKVDAQLFCDDTSYVKGDDVKIFLEKTLPNRYKNAMEFLSKLTADLSVIEYVYEESEKSKSARIESLMEIANRHVNITPSSEMTEVATLTEELSKIKKRLIELGNGEY